VKFGVSIILIRQIAIPVDMLKKSGKKEYCVFINTTVTQRVIYM